jgi:nitronate monooxygenase
MVTGLIHDLPTCAELIARILRQASDIAARGFTFKVPAA